MAAYENTLPLPLVEGDRTTPLGWILRPPPGWWTFDIRVLPEGCFVMMAVDYGKIGANYGPIYLESLPIEIQERVAVLRMGPPVEASSVYPPKNDVGAWTSIPDGQRFRFFIWIEEKK